MAVTVREKLQGQGVPVPPRSAADVQDDTASAAAIIEQFPDEPICPDIPGVIYDAVPELEAFGEIISGAISNTTTLIERVTNPPKGTSITLEISSALSSASDKVEAAIKEAGVAFKDQIDLEYAKTRDLFIQESSPLVQAVDAVSSGLITLRQNIYDLPADIVEGAWPGFKKAVVCLVGEPGSSEKAFKDKPEQIAQGKESGVGLNSGSEIRKAEAPNVAADVTRVDVGINEGFATVISDEDRKKAIEEEKKDRRNQLNQAASLNAAAISARKAREAEKARIIASRGAVEAEIISNREASWNQLAQAKETKDLKPNPTYTYVNQDGIGYIVVDKDTVNVVNDPRTNEINEIITVEEARARGVNIPELPIAQALPQSYDEYANRVGESL